MKRSQLLQLSTEVGDRCCHSIPPHLTALVVVRHPSSSDKLVISSSHTLGHPLHDHTDALSIDCDWFITADERTVFYRSIVPAEPRAILILNHGVSEHSGRYAHVMRFFAERGIAVFAEDHRGHGRTARTLGDVESFDAILGDLAVLHRNALQRLPGLPVFLLGHSMGGLLSVLYAERTPGLTGAIFNAAALDVPDDVSPVLLAAVRVLAKLTPRLGVEPFYDPSSLTDDPAVIAAIEADPLFYKGKMRARTGNELVQGIRHAVASLANLRLPMLVTHGTADTTVPPRASEVLFGAATSHDKQLHFFDGMKHEVHNHLARQEVLEYWWKWLETRL